MSTKFVVEANVYDSVWVAVEEYAAAGGNQKPAVDAALAYMERQGQQTRVRKIVDKVVFFSSKPSIKATDTASVAA